jgi:hypothetical protein
MSIADLPDSRMMNHTRSGRIVWSSLAIAGICGLILAAGAPARAAAICFASSKSYQIHPVRGGADIKDGWTVKGDAFAQCVHRAEAADRSLHARYPDNVYALSPVATIGCHSPCA